MKKCPKKMYSQKNFNLLTKNTKKIFSIGSETNHYFETVQKNVKNGQLSRNSSLQILSLNSTEIRFIKLAKLKNLLTF